MFKKICLLIFTIGYAVSLCPAQEEYLRITTKIEPSRIKQGEEGKLTIKLSPISTIKISSHPEFMIKLEPNKNLTFSKNFFTASELNFQTYQEKDGIFLDLEKEIEIFFKVKEDSRIGRDSISGDVIFTAVFKKDNWSIKTFQKFQSNFTSTRKSNKTKNRSPFNKI